MFYSKESRISALRVRLLQLMCAALPTHASVFTTKMCNYGPMNKKNFGRRGGLDAIALKEYSQKWRYQPHWSELFPWVQYSVSADGAFCAPCLAKLALIVSLY